MRRRAEGAQDEVAEAPSPFRLVLTHEKGVYLSGRAVGGGRPQKAGRRSQPPPAFCPLMGARRADQSGVWERMEGGAREERCVIPGTGCLRGEWCDLVLLSTWGIVPSTSGRGAMTVISMGSDVFEGVWAVGGGLFHGCDARGGHTAGTIIEKCMGCGRCEAQERAEGFGDGGRAIEDRKNEKRATTVGGCGGGDPRMPLRDGRPHPADRKGKPNSNPSVDERPPAGR